MRLVVADGTVTGDAKALSLLRSFMEESGVELVLHGVTVAVEPSEPEAGNGVLDTADQP